MLAPSHRQRLRKRDRLLERHRRACRLFPLPRFLSEHANELSFEVGFELVLCSEVRIHHDVGVAVELGDGSTEPGGAVGGAWAGREGNARQGFGYVC
jgi:hypothetical protein